ncbi:tetratricopeptide repeat protein [Chlamydiota bacterium]
MKTRQTKYWVVLLICLFGITTLVFSQTYKKELFSKANRKYEEGRYLQAIRLYEEILSLKGTHADVFYNLGNAYFKENQFGKAILNYERALMVDKRHKQARENLSILRSMIQDKEPFVKKMLLEIPFLLLKEHVTLKEILFFSMFLFWFILAISLGLLFFKSQRKLFFRLTIILMIILIISILSGIIVFVNSDDNAGIVMISEVPVLSGPGDTYSIRFKLHEGTKVFIQEKKYNWYHIYLINKMSGWIREESIEKI